MTVESITLTRPDDWHLHLRDQPFLADTVPYSARYFKRAIVMPNLVAPVVTTRLALEYWQRIKNHIPPGSQFEPLMTLYLTDTLSAEEVATAQRSGIVKAIKYYPAGATTNSENGVTDIRKVYPALECMQELGMPLLLHGEVTDSAIDIFDREAVFIEQILRPLLQRFPKLRVVLEHITTQDAVNFVLSHNSNLAATITAHHLHYNRNHMLAGGIRPHFYCLPILKRNTHQQALISAATSGNPKFFLGTDSAPHARHSKEQSCGCAGVFSAHAALELYAEAFELQGALDKLECFASVYGPEFYGLPRNIDTVTLQRQAWRVPEELAFGDHTLVPMRAGETILWRVAGKL